MDQADLQAIADLTVQAFGLTMQPIVEWNNRGENARRGYARYKTGHISIPVWAKSQGEEYLTYYVIHEVSHLIARHEAIGRIAPHGSFFKHIERQAMAHWGIELKFTGKKAYPDKVVCNGMVKWNRDTAKF